MSEDVKDKTAGWWAGDSEECFSIGPFATKQEAIDEALRQECFHEFEDEHGVWIRCVFYMEGGGLHYDCAECGIVPEACEGCKDSLYPEEYSQTFAWSRNKGCQEFPYESEQ